jgi:membrane protease YdiL (CAAX protease family)
MTRTQIDSIPPTCQSNIGKRYDLALLITFLLGIFSSLWLPALSAPKILLGFVLLIAGWRHLYLRRNQSAFTPIDQPDHSLAAASSDDTVCWRHLKSWGLLLSFTCIAAAVLLALGKTAGSIQGPVVAALLDKSTSEWWLVKLPTVVGQQILLQLFLLPILLRLFDVKICVVLGAVVFSLLHLPNPILMLVTLIGGLVWMASFAKYVNLPAVVFSHCVLAIIVAGCGGEYLLNMRVGWACVEIFPRSIQLDNETAIEFPGCVVGNAERLIQHGDVLIIQGWAYDFVHHGCPTALAVEIDRKLIQIDRQKFTRCRSDDWPTANAAGFVGDDCFAFEIEIPIANLQLSETLESKAKTIQPSNRSFRLFAANANGRWSKIGQMGKLTAIDLPHVDQAVVLFPVEIDGRVDLLGWTDGQLNLRGWAADLKTKSLANKIVCQIGSKQTTFDLDSSRLPRPGIVDSYKQPAFLQSGFNVSTAASGVNQLDEIRCFAVDQNQKLHLLTITNRAQKEFTAKLTSRHEATLIR